MPTGDKPEKHEWEETFHDDAEFLEEFTRIYDNPEVSDDDKKFIRLILSILILVWNY